MYISHIYVSGFIAMTCNCILYGCGSLWYVAWALLIRTASLSWNMITFHRVISSTDRQQRKYLGSLKAFCLCSVVHSFYDF